MVKLSLIWCWLYPIRDLLGFLLLSLGSQRHGANQQAGARSE